MAAFSPGRSLPCSKLSASASAPASQRTPPPPPPRALAALRQATRDRHGRIDRLMDVRRLAQPDRYGRVLQVFEAFTAAWEEAVAAALPAHWHGWLAARSRRQFLQQDLRALALPAASRAVPRPVLPDAPAAWGALYVMEGSALGGQVITRALARAGLDPASGAAYFHGFGEATAGMWDDFRGRLESELPDPAWLACACAAACHTFDALCGLLEQELHERVAPA